MQSFLRPRIVASFRTCTRPSSSLFAPLATTATTTTRLSAPRSVLLPTTSSSSGTRYRAMASASGNTAATAPPLQEWLVIAPDFEGALEKRLSVRSQHLEDLSGDAPDFWLVGGVLLQEPLTEGKPPLMKGSVMICGAKTKEEVLERLKRDVYITGGVWDWEKVQIFPYKSSLRKAL